MSFSHRIYFPYHTTYHTLFLYTDSVFLFGPKMPFLRFRQNTERDRHPRLFLIVHNSFPHYQLFTINRLSLSPHHLSFPTQPTFQPFPHGIQQHGLSAPAAILVFEDLWPSIQPASLVLPHNTLFPPHPLSGTSRSLPSNFP